MATKITTIYDKFITDLGTLFPNHNRLTNPYTPAENSELDLKQGFGLVVGQGVRESVEIGCTRFWVSRSVIIVLTRKFLVREFDVTSKATEEKNLLEDHYALVNFYEKNPQMEIASSVVDISWESDTGIEFVFTEKDNYLKIETTFSFKYNETIT